MLYGIDFNRKTQKEMQDSLQSRIKIKQELLHKEGVWDIFGKQVYALSCPKISYRKTICNNSCLIIERICQIYYSKM